MLCRFKRSRHKSHLSRTTSNNLRHLHHRRRRHLLSVYECKAASTLRPEFRLRREQESFDRELMVASPHRG